MEESLFGGRIIPGCDAGNVYAVPLVLCVVVIGHPIVRHYLSDQYLNTIMQFFMSTPNAGVLFDSANCTQNFVSYSGSGACQADITDEIDNVDADDAESFVQDPSYISVCIEGRKT